MVEILIPWILLLKNGADDIKKHKWFRGTEWDKLEKGECVTPYKPDISSENDTKNFDKYPESFEDNTAASGDPYKQYFVDFC